MPRWAKMSPILPIRVGAAAGGDDAVEDRRLRRRDREVLAVGGAREALRRLAGERPRDHPPDPQRMHDLRGDPADLEQPLEPEMRLVRRDLQHAVGRGVEDRLARRDVLDAEVADHRHARGMRVAERAGQPGARDQRLGHRRRDRRVGAREVVPLPGHRNTGELPVPRGRVLAARHLGRRRPDPGGRRGEARQLDRRGGPDRLPEPERGEVRDVERPGPAGLGPARGAGLHDVPERVGAFVAEGGRVGGAAAADAVHDQQRRPRHQAIRSRISGVSGGAASPIV